MTFSEGLNLQWTHHFMTTLRMDPHMTAYETVCKLHFVVMSLLCNTLSLK
jgi:hypothetical protein